MKEVLRFPTISICALLLFFIVGGFTIYSLSFVTDADRREYQALMEHTDPEHQEENYSARQRHGQVCKDMLFFDKGQRLHLRLRCAEADLILDRHEERTEMMEQMRHVTCCMQEELFYLLQDGQELVKKSDGQFGLRNDPNMIVSIEQQTIEPMQVIRYLTADSAVYHYFNDQFIAENVHISRFVVPGHALTETFMQMKPLMTGTARTVHFSLSGKDLNFVAHDLKATFHTNKKGLIK